MRSRRTASSTGVRTFWPCCGKGCRIRTPPRPEARAMSWLPGRASSPCPASDRGEPRSRELAPEFGNPVHAPDPECSAEGPQFRNNFRPAPLVVSLLRPAGRFMRRAHRMPFGAEVAEGGIRFSLWAPTARDVALALDGSEIPMPQDEGGWRRLTVR